MSTISVQRNTGVMASPSSPMKEDNAILMPTVSHESNGSRKRSDSNGSNITLSKEFSVDSSFPRSPKAPTSPTKSLHRKTSSGLRGRAAEERINILRDEIGMFLLLSQLYFLTRLSTSCAPARDQDICF